MQINDIIQEIKKDLSNNVIKVVSSDGYRYYTDVMTESIIIPITTPEETARAYEKLMLNPRASTTTTNLFKSLPRLSMFIGQPDTGKTYKAEQIAKDCGITPIFKMCRDSLNLETLLEDFKLIDGKPVFEESLAIKALTGTKEEIIIFDEFNTLLTGVMKTTQPIFDDTSTTFEYRGKIYQKNMNCKFIVTLNDKDKGISIVPDAILSRAKLTWFEPVSPTTIAKWTGVPLQWINDLFQIYKACGLLGVFGTRQVKMLKHMSSMTEIKNHLYGLCMMKSIDAKILDTLQVQNLINKL